MWCALIPTHMESVQGTNHKHRQARALALQLFTLRGTHICLQVKGLHTYTHACVFFCSNSLLSSALVQCPGMHLFFIIYIWLHLGKAQEKMAH